MNYEMYSNCYSEGSEDNGRSESEFDIHISDIINNGKYLLCST